MTPLRVCIATAWVAAGLLALPAKAKGEGPGARYEARYDGRRPIYAGPYGAHAPTIVDRGLFEQALAPYGRWFYTREHGRVWQPSRRVVGASFHPYTNGRWEYTHAGWTWVSSYDWGWRRSTTVAGC